MILARRATPRHETPAAASAACRWPAPQVEGEVPTCSVTTPDDTLARMLARAVSERSRPGGAAIGAPLLQRTPETAAKALKAEGVKSVSTATLNKWLNKRASSEGQDRTKNAAAHNVTTAHLKEINEALTGLWDAERRKEKAAAAEAEARVDYAAGWTMEVSTRLGAQSGTKNITYTLLTGRQKADARADLLRLVAEAAGGNLHSAQIGSVVGGTAVPKAAKQIAGLNDPNARIDRQNPPPGAFNVQYQIGNGSHAGVIFAPEDPADVVLAKLVESLDADRIMRSPRAARH